MLVMAGKLMVAGALDVEKVKLALAPAMHARTCCTSAPQCMGLTSCTYSQGQDWSLLPGSARMSCQRSPHDDLVIAIQATCITQVLY